MGYDASAEDALCQNAAKVNLMCKQGNASPETLAQEGYPWVSELKTSDHLNYAVVAVVGETSIDLLMNNRTRQVSRSWFNRHATGNFTQLHRLTPEGKDAIGAASDSKDMALAGSAIKHGAEPARNACPDLDRRDDETHPRVPAKCICTWMVSPAKIR